MEFLDHEEYKQDYIETDRQGQNHIEEDFYFANSDKILLLMKEFKS